MKKIIVLLSVLVLIIVFSIIPSYAANKEGPCVCIDGKVVDFSITGQEPILDNGHILVPLRQIFESLGYQVTYNEASRAATVSNRDVSIEIQQNQKDFLVIRNGTEETKRLDASAKTTPSGRFVLPIRSVCEALGMEVEWNNYYQCIFIFSDDEAKANKTKMIERAKGTISSDKYNQELGWSPIELNCHTGFIDKTGKVVIPYDENNLWLGISNGLILRRGGDQDLYGYTDPWGEWVIKPQFIEAQPFSDGIAVVVCQEDFIQAAGRPSMPDGSIGPDIEGKCCYSAIDTTGKVLFTLPDGYYLNDFHEGIGICTDRNNNQHYITEKGQILAIGDSYTELHDFSEGIATVTIIYDREKSYYMMGAIDKTGKVIIPVKYQEVAPFHEGMSRVWPMNSTKSGYMNKSGQWAIKPIYEITQRFFSEGVAAVSTTAKKSNQWKFIDKTGKTVLTVPKGYEVYESWGSSEEGFNEGICMVYNWAPDGYIDGYEYIDRSGKFITNEKFGMDSRGCHNGLIYTKARRHDWSDQSYKYINKKGNTIYEGCELID